MRFPADAKTSQEGCHDLRKRYSLKAAGSARQCRMPERVLRVATSAGANRNSSLLAIRRLKGRREFTSSRDDNRSRLSLNENMGFATDSSLIGWLTLLDTPSADEDGDDVLAHEWESEMEARLRRDAFYVVRGSEDERLTAVQPP